MNSFVRNQVCPRHSARILSALLSTTLTITSALWGQTAKAPVDYVSPNIGSVGQMLGPTVPFVQHPYGMSRLVPITNPAVLDRYFADKIYGFTAGPGMLMLSTGEVGTE